jgi:hypothetical protein
VDSPTVAPGMRAPSPNKPTRIPRRATRSASPSEAPRRASARTRAGAFTGCANTPGGDARRRARNRRRGEAWNCSTPQQSRKPAGTASGAASPQRSLSSLEELQLGAFVRVFKTGVCPSSVPGRRAFVEAVRIRGPMRTRPSPPPSPGKASRRTDRFPNGRSARRRLAAVALHPADAPKRDRSAPKHHIDFLAGSDEFPTWAESLCI